MFEHHEICANNKKENNDAFQKLLYMRHMLIVSFRSHLCSVCALFSLIVQYSRSYEHRSQTVNVPFVQQSLTLYTAIIYTTNSPSSQYLHTIYSLMLYMYLCLKLIYSLNHHLRIACSSFVHMQVGLFLNFIPSFIWVTQFYSQILNIINHRFFFYRLQRRLWLSLILTILSRRKSDIWKMSTCRLYCWQWIIILIFLAAQIKDVKLLLDKKIFSFYALRSFFTKLYLIIYLNYFLSTGNTYQNSKFRSRIKIKVSISLSKCIRQVDVHAMFVIGFLFCGMSKAKE